jgi:hypothetical protein
MIRNIEASTAYDAGDAAPRPFLNLADLIDTVGRSHAVSSALQNQ